MGLGSLGKTSNFEIEKWGQSVRHWYIFHLFVIHKICTQFSTSAERGAVGGRGACSRNIISLALQTPRVGTHTTNTRHEKILEQTHPWHPTSAGNFRHIYHLLFCTRPLKCSAKMILPLKLVLIFTRPILGGREFFDQKLHLAQVRLLRPNWGGWANVRIDFVIANLASLFDTRNFRN